MLACDQGSITAMPEGMQLPVVIVGGGYSGSMLAVRLLRLGQAVLLVERNRNQLGLGVAYRTQRSEHLLNVRASNMAAFGDDAAHFSRWLGIPQHDPRNHFIPRKTYGEYLQSILSEALETHRDRDVVIEDEAVGLRPVGSRIQVELASGARLEASAVVLALGNFPPTPIAAFSCLPGMIYHSDPWAVDALSDIGSRDHVLLVGTGLTAVDVTMTLLEQGFQGKITALSRRGLRPMPHAEVGPLPSAVTKPADKGSWLIRSVRRRAEQVGWRAAVDELRPHTQAIWRSHDVCEQRRFLRHLRPYWDVHRHRIAPHVSARLSDMEACGRLRFAAGKVLEVSGHDGRAVIAWRPRGHIHTDRIVADHVVSCIGPEADVDKVDHRLLKQMRLAGLTRADPHHIGIDVDQDGRLLNAQGHVDNRIFAIGPITKSEAWETVAIPDIRDQISNMSVLAAHMLNQLPTTGLGMNGRS